MVQEPLSALELNTVVLLHRVKKKLNTRDSLAGDIHIQPSTTFIIIGVLDSRDVQLTTTTEDRRTTKVKRAGSRSRQYGWTIYKLCMPS